MCVSYNLTAFCITLSGMQLLIEANLRHYKFSDLIKEAMLWTLGFQESVVCYICLCVSAQSAKLKSLKSMANRAPYSLSWFMSWVCFLFNHFGVPCLLFPVFL